MIMFKVSPPGLIKWFYWENYMILRIRSSISLKVYPRSTSLLLIRLRVATQRPPLQRSMKSCWTMKWNSRARTRLSYRSLPMQQRTRQATTITTAVTFRETATTMVETTITSLGRRTTMATLVPISLLVGIKDDVSSVESMATVHDAVQNFRVETRRTTPTRATTLLHQTPGSREPTLSQLRLTIQTTG